ncbi:MAG: glycosyltransferase, partial [Dehalococcoidia bacterium]|nr:glycosyltransferase [Dehalococcoidia bacterium]
SPHLLLPICGKAPMSTLTGALRRRLLRRTMEQLGLRDPILWLYRPEMSHLIGQFGEKLTVYHVVDEYTSYRGVDGPLRDFLHRAELETLAKASMVVVVSQSLFRSKAPFNVNTFMIPNGVDYEAFQRAAERGETPGPLRAIPGPILGYIGLISARLDLACLRRLLVSHPQCSLVLLGSIDPSGAEDQLRDLLACPQVYYLGRKPPGELPNYLARFDVCLIPYRMEEEAMNADPLKVYEYLAAGKPIVATSIPSLQRFSTVLRLASTEEEFLQAVRDVLSGEDPALTSRRRILAMENSWEDRVERISQLIQSRLTTSSGPCSVS